MLKKEGVCFFLSFSSSCLCFSLRILLLGECKPAISEMSSLQDEWRNGRWMTKGTKALRADSYSYSSTLT